MRVNFTIDGEPKAKARPRINISNDKGEIVYE